LRRPAAAFSAIETPEAKAKPSDAVAMAGIHMKRFSARSGPNPVNICGARVSFEGEPRVVVSLTDQLAYLYRGDALVAVAAISTGKDEKADAEGIFTILDKR
jgi:hypothetical protein